MTWRRSVSLAVAGIILCAAGWLLWRSMRQVSFAEIVAAVEAEPPGLLMLAALLTAASFAALASYDVFAARVVAPGRIGAARAALAGATSNAFANTLGFPAVTATAVRLRLYRDAGVSVGDIARITALSAATLVLGFAAMLAIALLMQTGEDPSWTAPMGGLAIVAALGGLLVWLWRGPRRLGIGGIGIDLPTARLALIQMIVGAGEMGAAIGALYVLLPADTALAFPAFAAACVGAIAFGIGSQSPGGLGVFEAAMIEILGGEGRADILGALLAYRLIYNIGPFVLSALAIGWFEATRISSKADSAK